MLINILKLITLFFLLVWCHSKPAFTQTLVGNTWANAQHNKSGTIVLTYIHTPAFSFRNPNNSFGGICADIVKAFIQYVKQYKGVTLRVKVIPETAHFNKFMSDVKNARGGVFGLGNVTITEERKRYYDFSPPFINNLAFLVTHNSIPTLGGSVKNIATHFKGMKAYTVKGTTNEKYLLEIKNKYYPSMQVIYKTKSGEVLSKVAGDNRSFAIIDFNYFVQGLKLNIPIKRHSAGDNHTEKFGIILPKNSDWTPLWREFFIQHNFLKSIEYRKILIKHLGLSAVKALDRYN